MNVDEELRSKCNESLTPEEINERDYVLENETNSIVYFKAFLNSKGFEDIDCSSAISQYEFYDVSATYKGEKYRFELKRSGKRATNSYNDAGILEDKYLKFKEGFKKGDFKKGFLVTFFLDKWVMCDLRKDYHQRHKELTTETTEFDRNDKKTYKWFVQFHFDRIFSY